MTAAVTALHDSMGRLAGSRASQNYEQLQRHSSSADTSDIFTCMNLLVLSLHSPMRNNSPAPTKPAQVVFASSPPLSPRVGDPWTEDQAWEAYFNLSCAAVCALYGLATIPPNASVKPLYTQFVSECIKSEALPLLQLVYLLPDIHPKFQELNVLSHVYDLLRRLEPSKSSTQIPTLNASANASTELPFQDWLQNLLGPSSTAAFVTEMALLFPFNKGRMTGSTAAPS